LLEAHALPNMVIDPVAEKVALAVAAGHLKHKTLRGKFETKGVREKSPLEADVRWVCVSHPVACSKET